VFYGFVFCILLLFIGNIIMLLGIVVASMMEFSFLAACLLFSYEIHTCCFNDK